MKLSYSNVRGKATNTSYPFVADIDSVDDLKRIAVYDHVCAVYDDGQNQRGYFIKGYRSTKTFKFSDCLPFDRDNVSSDALAPDIDESKWKTPQDVASAFPNVRFYIVYSRNHMKEKDGKKARPKFHVYFPLFREIKNTREYNELKKTVRGAFPAFDDKALDAARFLYGVENPQVEYFDGMFTIDEFVNRKQTEISEGARNSTLSHFAGQVLKRFGDDNGKAHEAFLKKADCCVPPLEDDELNTIWKRFVIAAELQEGTRLDTAALKNLCSTDRVQAEKKFEAPFSFIPTHTTVLYTNHLPKVGTTDRGTWDRIVIIPLTASFRGSKNEIKNYGDVLFKRAGEAILQWMVEGAKEYIKNDFKVEMPECVKEAIAEYKSENDWLAHFIDECCEIDSRYTQKAGELYECYRTYCDKVGEYKRSSSDFKFALTQMNFDNKKTMTGLLWFGIRLKADYCSIF